MRFSSWYTAAQIEQQAPASPGVFQVRAGELRDYPSGRSAMIHYGRGEDLRTAIGEWAASFGPRDARYRHVEALGSQTPAQVLERLSSRFRTRFGHEPRGAIEP